MTILFYFIKIKKKVFSSSCFSYSTHTSAQDPVNCLTELSLISYAASVTTNYWVAKGSGMLCTLKEHFNPDLRVQWQANADIQAFWRLLMGVRDYLNESSGAQREVSASTFRRFGWHWRGFPLPLNQHSLLIISTRNEKATASWPKGNRENGWFMFWIERNESWKKMIP